MRHAVATLNGVLAGLVGSTSCAIAIEPWSAPLLGALSALAFIAASKLLLRYGIDDPYGKRQSN